MPSSAFWRPVEEKRLEPLLKELKQVGVKPRLAFPLAPSRETLDALEVLSAKKPQYAQVARLLAKADDELSVLAGLHAVRRLPGSGKDGQLAERLEELAKPLRNPGEATELTGMESELVQHPLATVEMLETLKDARLGAVPAAAKAEILRRRGPLSRLHSWLRNPWSRPIVIPAHEPPHKVAEAVFWQVFPPFKRPFAGKTNYWLLGSQKPVFATPHRRALVKRLAAIDGISRGLKKEFGDGFVGITVFGSSSKGYWREGRDLDYALIGSNPKVAERFEELSKGLRACESHYLNVDRSEPKKLSPLFRGLFFGDHGKLRQLQKKAVAKMSESEWRSLRADVYFEEIRNLEKADYRFGIPAADRQLLRLVVARLRVPPGLAEMRERLGVK
jgi:predicted nucleotidyltransferase